MSTPDDKRLQDQVNAANNAGAVAHDCRRCADCLHDGKKCCGCYDNACCQADDTPPDSRSEVETLPVLRGIILGALLDSWSDETEYDGAQEVIARAILASDWLAQHDAQVAAKALRAAADHSTKFETFVYAPGHHEGAKNMRKANPVAHWLRDRADRIGGDRG